MTNEKRVNRNVAMATIAAAKGKEIRFTYTNRKGETKRRVARPMELRPTKMGVVLVAQDDEGIKSFRFDRMRITTVL